MRQRFAAMRNIPPFLREIWATSKPLTLASISLRLVRAFLPIATLYVGKLIIDEAIRLIGLDVGNALGDAWRSGALDHLLALLARATGSRLGGPRYYQGQLVRFPVFNEGSEPDANLPLRLLQHLLLIGWGWLGLSLLLTLMALNHG